MNIVITAWALDSYLNLKHTHVFTDQEYKGKIRPDVNLLKTYPQYAKFKTHLELIHHGQFAECGRLS